MGMIVDGDSSFDFDSRLAPLSWVQPLIEPLTMTFL